MASQRSSSASIQSNRDGSVLTYLPPSWVHNELEQYYHYPSLSKPPPPGHGTGESNFTTLSSPSSGLKGQRHPSRDNTSREPHLDNADSRGSDIHQPNSSTAPSHAGNPWQRNARADITIPPSLATLQSLTGNSGQAPPTPTILSSLGSEGSGYCRPTPGLSTPFGVSLLFPQLVSLPGEYNSRRNSGSLNKSSFSEEECCVTPCSPTVRYHVDSGTLFGDFESPDKVVGLPPRPPARRSLSEEFDEPRTPIRSNSSQIPYSSYNSDSPNIPGFPSGLSPSPPVGKTRRKIDFNQKESIIQLSPESFSPRGPRFSRDVIPPKTIPLTPIKEEPSIDSLSPLSSQMSPESFSPRGPRFSRDAIPRKTNKPMTPITEESWMDSSSPTPSLMSPEPFSPLGPPLRRDDVTRKAIRRRKPPSSSPQSKGRTPPKPKDTLGDAEFWRYIRPHDISSCSSDTSDYASPLPPNLPPPRLRQRESTGWNLDANVPFSRPRTVGEGQPQAAERRFDQSVPFQNPGITRREQTVSNLTSRTYQNFIQKQNMALIMFYSSSTGGPETPDILKSYSMAPGATSPALASVDCAREAGLCASEGVPSYPFYKLYHRGYLLSAVKELDLLNTGPQRK